MKIIGISGSIVGSKTALAVDLALKMISEKDSNIQTELVKLGDYQLVFSDGRDYRDYQGDTQTLIHKIMEANALIIGTPTYQASIPGALKNVFDLLPKEAFFEKTVGVIATAGSDKHYLMAENQLKPILNYMKATVVSKYVFVNEAYFFNEQIINDDVTYRLRQLAEDVLNLAQLMDEFKQRRDDAFDF